MKLLLALLLLATGCRKETHVHLPVTVSWTDGSVDSSPLYWDDKLNAFKITDGTNWWYSTNLSNWRKL